MELNVGMKVEARSNEEGYRGAWVEGIVKTINKQDNTITLEKPSRDDGKVLVDVSLGDVRPIPPHRPLPLDSLDGAAVEAKDEDCWWPGFIVREISCNGCKLWLVNFPQKQFLLGYPLPLSPLRPAQEWVGGKWTLVPPEKNLNIGQVMRVLSADNKSEEEILKSSSHWEASSSGNESKENPVSMRLEEQNQRCKEADQNAKEEKATEEIEIEDDEEAAEQEVEDVPRQRKVEQKYYRRRHHF